MLIHLHNGVASKTAMPEILCVVIAFRVSCAYIVIDGWQMFLLLPK